MQQPEIQTRRLERTGLAQSSETRGLTGTGLGLGRQEAAGWVFGRVRNHTEPFTPAGSGPLAGYPKSLLSLSLPHVQNQCQRSVKDCCPSMRVTHSAMWSVWSIYIVLTAFVR